MDWWPATTKPILKRHAIKTPFSYCINRRKASDVISSPFHQRGCSTNGRPLALHARGTGVDAPHLQFLRGARKSEKKWQQAANLLDQKKHWSVRPIFKRKHLKRKELPEKAISAPNRQGVPQKDVERNTTLLISESKRSLWHKQLLWTPPARHVNRKGKRLACEKLMDWWLTATKPILERYAIKESVQLLHSQKKGFRCHKLTVSSTET